MSSTTVQTVKIKVVVDDSQAKVSLKSLEKTSAEAGKQTGSSFMSRLKNSLNAAVVEKAFSKITGLVSKTMSSAISRMDTLNNFPQVMTGLGYSAEDASSSIESISSHLDDLPTTLDDMVSGVQSLAATMGNLADGEVNATSVGLALNDMLLAGGKGTQAASNAMEQYNQMLAVGKVDMQAWRSVVNAAPGQMDQLAKSLLGAEANQATLYDALKDGAITFDEMNAALVRLDKEGGDGFASFNEQAIAGTQGLQTQLGNISTSLTKVVTAALQGTDIEEPLEQLSERITAVIPTMVDAFSKSVVAIASIIPKLLPPIIQAIIDATPAVVEGITQLIVALAGYLPDFTQGLIDFITTLTNAIVDQLPTILMAVVDGIIGVVLTISKPENLRKIMQSALELLLGIVDAIPDIIVALVDALPEIIEGVVSFLTNPESWGMILGGAIHLFGALIEAVPRILGSLLGAFGRLVGDLWNGITGMFGEFAKNFGDFIGGIFKGAINGVIGFIEGFINTPIGIINGFIDIINGAFGWIGVSLGKIDLVHLPRLATGGIVPATAGGQLILAGEGGQDEWVVPESKMASLIEQLNDRGTAGGETYNIYVNGVFATSDLERRRVADQIVEAIEQNRRVRFI